MYHLIFSIYKYLHYQYFCICVDLQTYPQKLCVCMSGARGGNGQQCTEAVFENVLPNVLMLMEEIAIHV